VTPRTVAPPPDHGPSWRKVLGKLHPDAPSGDESLFVWLAAVREHVLGADGPSSSRGASERPQSYEAGSGRAHARRRSSGASGPTRERIPCEAAFWKAASFSELTRQALTLAERVGDPYASVLRLLADCVEAPERESVLYRQQNQGCSYKQLAAIAYRGWG
jgi:hypothetical protein